MPINKADEKGGAAAVAKDSFYAAIRRVQTQRSAASISNGCNILFAKTKGSKRTLFSRATRIPIKGTITIPYGVFATVNGTDKCSAEGEAADPMNERSLPVQNYTTRFPVCTDAFEDAPGLEDFYTNAIRLGLERSVDGSIIYTVGTSTGLVGVIGPSAATGTGAAARGSVAVNNASAGTITVADIQVLISVLDPYGYDVEDLVIMVRPDTWQELIAEVSEGTCCNRINQAARTFDGYQVALCPSIPAGQAGVASMSQYLIGVRKDIELTTCGACDTAIRGKARMAGAMAGVGGGLSTNTGTNTGTVELGAAGVYAAYLTGVANS